MFIECIFINIVQSITFALCSFYRVKFLSFRRYNLESPCSRPIRRTQDFAILSIGLSCRIHDILPSDRKHGSWGHRLSFLRQRHIAAHLLWSRNDRDGCILSDFHFVDLASQTGDPRLLRLPFEYRLDDWTKSSRPIHTNSTVHNRLCGSFHMPHILPRIILPASWQIQWACRSHSLAYSLQQAEQAGLLLLLETSFFS